MNKRTLGAVTSLLGLALMLLGFMAAPSAATVDPDTNSVAYWCGSEDAGVKIDNYEDDSFTVPAPPEGKVWTLLVLKAGSVESTTVVNETYPNPVPGDTYVRSDGKGISHIILCFEVSTTTTTAPPTTSSSSTTTTEAETTSTTEAETTTTTEAETTTTTEAETTTTTEGETTTTSIPTGTLFSFGTAGTVCTPFGVPYIQIVFANTFPELAGDTGTLFISSVDEEPVGEATIVYAPGSAVSLLYPGTVVNDLGYPIDLPGFSVVDGEWVADEEDDILLEGLLLRYELGDQVATAEIEYPPAETLCAAPTNTFGPPPNTTVPVTPTVPTPTSTTILVKVNPPGKGPATITTSPPVGGTALPRTGGDSMPLVTLGVVMLALGTAAIVKSRRSLA